MSADHTLRKLAKQRRAIARPRLQHLLHWATWHALQPLRGVPLTHDARELAIPSAVHSMICYLANQGAFLYFGIGSAFDLGAFPVTMRYIDAEGSAALEVEPLADHIMRGGARGLGWLGVDELTTDDLSR